MKVRYLLCAASLIGFFLFATAQEKTAPLSQEQLEAIAIQPASNWRETANVVPEMIPLFKEESINFGGKNIKYRLRIPQKLEAGKKYPMILWLHGIGEVGSDNKLQLIHLHHIITQLTGEKQRDFFLLVPQHESGDHWVNDGSSGGFRTVVNVPKDVKDGKKTLEQYKKELMDQTKAAHPDSEVTIVDALKANIGFGREVKEGEYLYVTAESAGKKGGPLEFAFAMVEKTVKNYPVDADRITVSGLSSGGDGTWRALERRPDLFAAAVPLVSWSPLTDKSMEKSPVLKKIPIWAIYSSDDNSIDQARADFERVEKAGANVKKTEFGICGHTAWTPAMLQADIFAWLLSRTKKGGEYTAVYDPGVNPDDMKGIVDVATRDPGKPAMAPAVRPGTISSYSSAPVPATAMPPEQARAEQRKQIEESIQERMQSMRQPEVMVGLRAPGSFTVSHHFPPSPEKDAAYAALAEKYFLLAQMRQPLTPEAFNTFKECTQKISPKAQIRLIEMLVSRAQSVESAKVLEELLDAIPFGGMPMMQPVPGHFDRSNAQGEISPYRVSGDVRVQRSGEISPVGRNDGEIGRNDGVTHGEVTPTPTISAEKIIEECDRPWAMTSESLYGMFPADWDKEAMSIPDFIVSSTSDDLAKKLARSVGEDPEAADFVAACKSILSLTNKPMSSPWFETGGGRLRSDISYSLSAKGQMFVRFLRTVKDSGKNSDKARELSKVAEKTLEKIEMVLAK